MLLYVRAEYIAKTSDDIDRVISAEISEKEAYPVLHEIILTQNIHRCSPERCLKEDGTCAKRFFRPLVESTQIETDSFPLYRRDPVKSLSFDQIQGDTTSISARPFQMLYIDHFEKTNSDGAQEFYLLAVDAFTRFFVCEPALSLDAETTGSTLVRIFTTFGIPRRSCNPDQFWTNER